jgi:hypothetical protein
MNHPPARSFVHARVAAMTETIEEQRRASLAAFKIDPPLTQSEAHAASSLAFVMCGLVSDSTPQRVVAGAVLMMMAATFDTPDIVKEAAVAIGAPVNA